MAKTIIVIPARYHSQRFPGKVLFPLMGKPVLQWVYESARKSKIADEIIIATEDKRVFDFANTIGAKCVITSKNCNSGSDRVWEASKNIKCDFIVNLQSDEPFIEYSVLRKAIDKIRQKKEYDIATACAPIKDLNDIENPNCVKVVMNNQGKAIYFSRSPVPYHHKLSKLSLNIPYYKHCGFYIYRKKALEIFINSKETENENLERLEQLRSLDIGLNIVVVKVKNLGPAIDVPEDIKKAQEYFKKMGNYE